MTDEDSLFPDVRIVLIETTHPGNIGAAARAMKNMGLTSLVLVNPFDFPHEHAVSRAVGASDVVQSARVVTTVEEAIAGCHLVLGTSARDRRIPWPMLDPRACGEKIVAERRDASDIAILFGRESRGLKNEELQKCHYHVNIPTARGFSSLNLAMAVQVLAYEILMASGRPVVEQVWDQEFATAEAVEDMFAHLEQTLIEVNFYNPENPRQLISRLRRMFNRIRMDHMEVNMLRGFLTAINHRTRQD